MEKFTLVFALVFFPLALQAAETSYINVSKYMLNNAYVQSPVYTKKMYRSMRETDTYNYQTRLAELDMLKENRQISTREYNEKKTQLDKEYQKVYGHFNPATQASMIKKSPVESFYYGAMEPGERLNLISLSQGLTDAEHDVATPQMPDIQAQSHNEPKTLQNPLSRRSIRHLQADTQYDDTAEDITVSPIRPVTSAKKKVLGKKAIPVKIGAF